MDEFSSSMNDVKLQIFNAIESEENTGNKLETYRKYIKGMSGLFLGLDKDLESFPLEYDLDTFKSVREKHLSLLKTAKNCISRSITQLEDAPVINKAVRSISSFETPRSSLSSSLRSMPPKGSIDMLLAEKPLNPIDMAKSNLQNMINNTKKLLQSERLSSSQRISVQLQLSRMIEETLSIARKRENDICKIKINNLELLQVRIDEDIDHFSILRTDQELAQLYKSSLMFYHHILKGSKWFEMAQSDRCPEESCLSFILRMNEKHPIVLHIDKIIQILMSSRKGDGKSEIVTCDMRPFMERIQSLSMVCCLIGNINSTGRTCSSSQVLFNLLCNFIFSRRDLVTFIYDFLFILSEGNMNQYNSNMNIIHDKNDDSIILPEKFSRYSNVKELIDIKVREFSSLRGAYNPLDRMSKLCQIIRELMSVITEKNPKIEIGADELVPILSYMIIKFGNPEIVLHMKYLELLIPSDYMMGIEGYILVSVCCAMSFCTSSKFESELSSFKS